LRVKQVKPTFARAVPALRAGMARTAALALHWMQDRRFTDMADQ